MAIDAVDFETGTAYWQIVSGQIIVWAGRHRTDHEGITIEIEDMQAAITAYESIRNAQ